MEVSGVDMLTSFDIMILVLVCRPILLPRTFICPLLKWLSLLLNSSRETPYDRVVILHEIDILLYVMDSRFGREEM